MNWTPEELSKLLSDNPQVGIDAGATAVHPVNFAVKDTDFYKSLAPTLEDIAAEVIALFCEEFDYPLPDPEHRFHPVRKWRFDFAWPDMLLAVEIEGGTWANGRHNRAQGYEGDCEKYNAAVMVGWRVLRFTGDMVRDGRMAATLRQLPPF